MSGPVEEKDLAVATSDARMTEVGGVPVRRSLPRRGRRTVGAWCFADHLGPASVPLAIGPHPHIGLQTVTWLLDGAVLHRDSLGSEQLIRPGQLNLMTAGEGVSHSEEAPAAAGPSGLLEGVQLWVAQPASTRWGPAAFEHHPELPRFEAGPVRGTVISGSFGGVTSPARHDTPLVGVDLEIGAGRSFLELQPEWEHAVVVLRGAVAAGGTPLEPGRLGYLESGRAELELSSVAGARAVLLGGEPWGETVLMWWNFVARTPDEVAQARAAWQAEDARFGEVASRLARISAPPLTGLVR